MMNNIQKLFGLSNKVVAVSGAGGYLGSCIATSIAAVGANLALFDIEKSKERVEELAQKLASEYGITAKAYAANIADEDEIAELAKTVVQTFGKIDGLVNCAGINHHASIEGYSADDFNRMLSINVTGTFICCKHFGAYMCEHKSGSIVNIGSMSGHIVNMVPKVMVAYNTTKAAILHMTRAIAAEWGEYNVRCNSVSPGIMEHGMSNIKGFNPAETEYLEKMDDLTPMHRKIKAEELVGAIIYFLSDSSSGTTGEDILVDGGYHIW